MCEYTFENGNKCQEKPIKGSKFCILHCEFPDDHEGLVFKNILKAKEMKLKEKFEIEDFNFEGAILKNLNLSDKKISTDTNFYKSIIYTDINFNDVTFYGNLNFLRASIRGNAFISNINVKGDCFFADSIIGEDLNLKNVMIEKNAYFSNAKVHNRVNLKVVNIDEAASFSELEVGEHFFIDQLRVGKSLLIHEAKIEGELSFSDTNIDGLFSLDETNIGRNLAFRDVNIGKKANFCKVHVKRFLRFRDFEIEGDADFNGARIESFFAFFGGNFGGEVDFTGAKIGGQTYFGGITFEKSVIFGGTVIEGDLIFNENPIKNSGNDVTPKKCMFCDYLFLPNTKILGGFHVENTEYKKSKAQEEVFRKFRLIFEEVGDRSNADKYFVKEMQIKWKQKLEEAFLNRNNLQIFILLFEKIFGDIFLKYGTAWKRVLGVWFGVIFLSSIIFWMLGGVEYITTTNIGFFDSVSNSTVYIPISGYETATSLWDNVYFSILTITTLGYGDLHPKPEPLFQFLAGMVAIYGAFTWAAFIAIIARIYMR